jgi:hypothetical protein
MSILPVQTQIDNIITRLNLIDGNGLASTNSGAIAELKARILGVKSDIQGSVLQMESIVNQYAGQVAQYINLWQGRYGTGTSATPIAGIPAGTIDGENTEFTLPYSPMVLLLFVNGALVNTGYTVVENVIMFTEAPTSTPPTTLFYVILC